MCKMKWSKVLVVFMVVLGHYPCSSVPIWYPTGQFIQIYEDLPIESLLYTFTVTGDVDDIRNVSTNSYDTQQLVRVDITVPGQNVVVKIFTINEFDRDGHGNNGYPGSTSVDLIFKAEDTRSNTVTEKLTVYINDVNDNAPILQNIPYTWEIPERNAVQKIYQHISAVDYDNGYNGTGGLRFSITPKTQSASAEEEYMKTFTINNTTGYISLVNDTLDYETNSFYQFTVIVKDQFGHPGCKNDTADLITKILDVQDTPPYFIGIPYRTTITEGIATNTIVQAVSAMDGDRGIPNNVNYTIRNGPCSDLFTISHDGMISTVRDIDRDTGDIASQSGVCVLTIVAQEEDLHPENQLGNTTATANVTIYINDINDNAPNFNVNATNNYTYMASIQENTPRSVPVTLTGEPTEIIVEDADEGENAVVSLSLVYPNGSMCDDFYVTPEVIQKSGSTLIRVKDPTILDYEARNNITFIIRATDSGNHTVTATVFLDIEDMNDNNPQFDQINYVFDIPENSNSGTEVGGVKAHDKDSGEFGEVTYALYGGDDRFHIDNMTGIITTQCENCNETLDREKNSIHFMTLTATDLNGKVGGRSNSTSLVVNLSDVNDNSPTFLSNQYSASVDENDARYNSTNGTAILQVQATDKDEENTNNSRIQFVIDHILEEAQVPRGNLSLNATSGELFLVTPLDFEELLETSGLLHIIVHAIDFGYPSLTGTTTIVLQVQDVNDEMPIFEETQYNALIEENATSSVGNLTNVTRVHASDADGTEPSKKIQYFITDGAWSDFSINSTTGDVSVQINRNLDRDMRPSYNITIIAIDMGSPPLTGTCTLSVDIVDVNDKAPVFDPSIYTKAVLENQTDYMEEIIVNLKASDTDLNHVLEYDIIDVQAWDENNDVVNRTNVENYFKIHKANGSIFINQAPDREVAKTITLTVIVKDINAFDPPLQNDTATVTITIIDINDNPPVFEPSQYAVNVSENAFDPTILLTIRATDRDENRTMRYDIESVEHNVTSFTIDHETGLLSKFGVLDREEHATLTIEVSATDNGSPPLTSTTTVHVTILDFNDNAPEFINLTTTVHVLENATMNEEIITVYAEDKDEGPNARVQYVIESGAFEHFTIDRNHGNISVVGILDRETRAVYTLRIIAMDSPENDKDKKVTQAVITILIDDVNDNAPEFSSKLYTADILENVPIGTTVETVAAIDKDEPNTDNSEIHYSFGNNSDGLFRLDEQSGVIYVNKSLIGNVKSHVIELIATDNGNPMLRNNETSVINIMVNDVNLNNPVLANLPSNNTIKVPECVDVGFNIYLFNYTDADNGRNAEAFFNISDIDTEISSLETFEINPETGQLKTKAELDATIRHEYKFHIQVTDKGKPPLSSDKVTITVMVTDVDDNLPSFLTNKTTMFVEENRPPGTIVGSVTAYDADLDSVACYEIKGGNSNFAVGEKNGSILTKTELDYEDETWYTFNVEVTDCSLVVNISECDEITHVDADTINVIEVNVGIRDVNDNPPYFQDGEITVGMRRVTEVGVSLDLSLKTNDIVGDKDTVNNGRLVWVFNNSGPLMLSDSLEGKLNMEGYEACEDGIKHLVCVTGNGSLINNKYYSEDMSGYLIVPVGVSDEAGSDTTNVKIFLISDSQILVMTLLGRKEDIAEKKKNIMDLYSVITGYEFVYDWVEDHKTSDGKVETHKTDLYFHVVHPETQAILSAAESIRVVDTHYDDLLRAVEEYNVVSVVSSVRAPEEVTDPLMTVYIMAAVIVVLTLTVIIIVYVSMTTRSKFKTKLKAATVKPQDISQKEDIGQTAVPGSNLYSKLSNPLLDAELPPDHAEYDNMSMGSQNSLDHNDVGSPGKTPAGTGLEEREVTLDMYTEDTGVTGPVESPLDEALRLHQQDKNKRAGEIQDATAFDNFAFEEEFESTEI